MLTRLTRAQAAGLVIETSAGLLVFDTGALPMPPRAALRRMRGERVYAQSEIDGAAKPLRALRVALRPEGQAWLLITHSSAEFRSADGAQLARLAPHLGPAVDTWLTLTRERARARQAEQLAHALGAGWLWLDATGRVVDHDATARVLIEAAPGLRLSPAGWLEFTDSLLARRFRGSVETAVTGRGAQTLTLHRASGLHLALLSGLTAPAPGLDP
ncbi:MAG: hypothetical protein ACK4GT_15570, partial [Pararhodobacter sp.]